MIELYKTEPVQRKEPWKTIDDLELATLEWVDWYNHRRLHSSCGNIPPAEYEILYYQQKEPATLPGAIHGDDRPTHGGALLLKKVMVVQLGYFTACLPECSLEAIARRAHTAGFTALEVAAWPEVQPRGHTATHINVRRFGPTDADALREVFAKHQLTLSALSYYDNNLHPDENQRTEIHAHLRACIEAAALLEVPCVGTFVGRDPQRTVAENLTLAQRILPPLVEFAGEHGVKLAVENCPMEGWHPDGYPGNLAYSPEFWDWMFSLGLYLNYDPSHLLWLGIDPVKAIRGLQLQQHGDRIQHVQAKDTTIDADGRHQYSVFGRAINRDNPWLSGWWRHRLPGLGDVDWRGVIDALYEIGYDGTVAIEHEDPVWRGSEDRIYSGLEIARRTLQPFLVA